MASEGGYFKVPNELITEHGRTLGPSGIAVFCVLAKCARDGVAHPSHGAIARALGVGRHTVIRALKVLGACKLVAAQPNRGMGKGPGTRRTANRYVINGHANLFHLAGLEVPLVVANQTQALVANQTQALVANQTQASLNKTHLEQDQQQQQRPMKARNADGRTLEGVAVAASLAQEQELHKRALVSAGLPEALAAGYARAADPALIRETLAYHRARLDSWNNPAGALRSMLDRPEKWGFMRAEDGAWKAPATDPPASSPAQTQAELLAEREQAQRERNRKANLAPGGFKALAAQVDGKGEGK
jgi:hypothetical protein